MRWCLPACSAKSRVAVSISVSIAILLSLILPSMTLASPHHAVHKASKKAVQPAPKNQPAPEDYAEAAVMEPETGTFIFEKDDHQPWPTASLAKMMVMLIVAEKLHDGSLKLTDQVTTSRDASKMGGSQVYLKEGETFSLDDMMKAIVVHSANDASAAVAEYVAGSTTAFVEMMNQHAEKLGMK